jgi:hypothetical protein
MLSSRARQMRSWPKSDRMPVILDEADCHKTIVRCLQCIHRGTNGGRDILLGAAPPGWRLVDKHANRRMRSMMTFLINTVYEPTPRLGFPTTDQDSPILCMTQMGKRVRGPNSCSTAVQAM